MLILTRRINEAIIVGNNELTFMVLAVKGGQVRIGIDTRLPVAINREEIFRSIKDNQEHVTGFREALAKMG